MKELINAEKYILLKEISTLLFIMELDKLKLENDSLKQEVIK
ncbi:hypothetical protein Klosneuvirus_2_220 [Klosneuvirus KNV1]|uniref:Uncharacterized protein n=1 Tax=Klosneuvirus KNV1 TaxID=1977640 RepID=A0A1V0SJG4_9VIRU|nr:hypothetical protein Klosneuvirus_2_220 [Klosneuvirus KNV1]